jgi:hypothetical protein
MRILVVLICNLALACVAYGAQQEQNKPQKKKQAQPAQHTAPPTGHPAGAGAGSKKTSAGAYQGKKGPTSMGAYEGQKGKKGQTSTRAYEGQTGKAAKGGKVTGAGKPTGANATAATAGKPPKTGSATAGKPVKVQHFNLPKQPNTAKAPPVKFQQGKHIEGSQNWQGRNYSVFRNYKSEWHDRNWWHSHYNRVIFVYGGWYAWNGGYWYPAWGYAANSYYAYDAPIYAQNNLPPDQVIANVQSALQQQGYYHGEVDGLLGPLTRGAIADYQRDHGLYTTSTIDQPTLEALGMA